MRVNAIAVRFIYPAFSKGSVDGCLCSATQKRRRCLGRIVPTGKRSLKLVCSFETFERGDFASYRRMALWRWQRGLASNRAKPNGLMHENILVRAGDLLR